MDPVTSTNGGTGNTATANLIVATAPTITITFGAASIPLNGSTSLSFTITNPNISLSLTGVTFPDPLPAGLVTSTPNGVTGVCGGGTIAATPGTSNPNMSGATLSAGASCTFSFNVTGTTGGAKMNTTGTVISIQSGAGRVSNTATLTVFSPPVIAKTFGAASIAPGASTSLTFTIQNPNASAALAGVAVIDPLPSGLVISTPASLTGSCGGGTISATAGATSVTLSAGIIAASNSCTFAVNVTGTSSGTKPNTTDAVTSTNGGAGNIATASLAVLAPLVPDLGITSTHAGHFQQGQTGAVYTITVTNAGNGPSSGAITVTDILPAGLTAAAISGGGWTCTLGSLACTRADALAAGASYAALTVTVNVATTTVSSVTNTAIVFGGGETNTANDTASDVTIVDAPADFSIAAVATTAMVNKGSKAAYILTLTPLNNVPFASSITLAVSGVPQSGTAFQFQPASVTPGANPATSTLLLFTSTADTAIAANINRRTAPLFALGFVFGMPLAGMVVAGLRRKNGGLNLKSPGGAILLFVLMGVACYGCASAAINHNYGTPSGIYTLTVTATGGTVQHSIPVTLTVR